eukprot:11078119-Alexandrium_andersonii.AAC.1
MSTLVRKLFGLNSAMPPKGGAAQRAAARAAQDAEPPLDPGASSSSGAPLRGGMRQRVLGKRKPESIDPSSQEDIEHQRAYRDHLAKLYLKNSMSAKSTKLQLQLAQKAGAKGAEDLSKECLDKHAQRSLMRALCKGNPLPPLYYANVPCHDPTTAQNGHIQKLAFLLPHELLHSMVDKADEEKLAELVAPPTGQIFDLKESFCKSMQAPPEKTIPMGCFGDGVPHQKNKSVDTFTWNLLSQGPQGDRFLVTCIPKQFECKCGCSGRHTVDEILKVFAWSMKHCTLGLFPAARHDGSPWEASDSFRKDHRGPLGFQGALLQARGDWSYYKQVFGFPSWAAKQICWRCLAGTQEHPWTSFGSRASWRTARCTPGQFLKRQRDNGVQPSPLFSIPGFTLDMVVIDVLHCMDLGCSQDMLGNVFWEGLSLYTARNRSEQIKLLWASMKAHYKAMKTPVQLQSITEEMLKKDKKPPKLKAKGAETRHLVLFGLEIAQAMDQEHNTTHNRTVLQAMSKLAEIYILLGLKDWDSAAASGAMRSFCELYGALGREAERAGSICWRAKPKLHLAQELFEYQQHTMGNPASFWNYRDEDSMRLVGELAHQRGGRHLLREPLR